MTMSAMPTIKEIGANGSVCLVLSNDSGIGCRLQQKPAMSHVNFQSRPCKVNKKAQLTQG